MGIEKPERVGIIGVLGRWGAGEVLFKGETVLGTFSALGGRDLSMTRLRIRSEQKGRIRRHRK